MLDLLLFENRIVLSEKFYQKVKLDFEEMNINDENSIYHKISGKYLEDFKGVPMATEFRVLDV